MINAARCSSLDGQTNLRYMIMRSQIDLVPLLALLSTPIEVQVDIRQCIQRHAIEYHRQNVVYQDMISNVIKVELLCILSCILLQ